MRLLLDTSVLIDALRLRRRRREMLADLVHTGHKLTISAVNVAEVFAGMRPEEEPNTRRLLDALECYDITRASGQLAGRLKGDWARKGRTLTLADALVAAVALQHGCALVTDNRRDFPMPELQLYPLPEK